MISHPASELAVEKTVISGYNSKLVDRVNAFRNSHSGVRSRLTIYNLPVDSYSVSQVTTKIWDSNSAFTVVLNNPMQYGFVNTTSSGQTGDFWGYVLHFGSLYICDTHRFAETISTPLSRRTTYGASRLLHSGIIS